MIIIIEEWKISPKRVYVTHERMVNERESKKKRRRLLTNFESGSAIETELKSSILILSFSFLLAVCVCECVARFVWLR